MDVKLFEVREKCRVLKTRKLGECRIEVGKEGYDVFHFFLFFFFGVG